MAMTTPMIASPPTVLREIDGPEACSMCETPGLKTELVRNPFICGVGDDAAELVVDIPVHTCSRCQRSYTGKAAGIIEHEAVCRHLGLLTPSEIKDIRTSRDNMSQAAFAELTGLGEATIARWERGDVMQNRGNDRFLRMVQRDEGWRLLLQVVALGQGESAMAARRAAQTRTVRPEDVPGAARWSLRSRPSPRLGA